MTFQYLPSELGRPRDPHTWHRELCLAVQHGESLEDVADEAVRLYRDEQDRKQWDLFVRHFNTLSPSLRRLLQKAQGELDQKLAQLRFCFRDRTFVMTMAVSVAFSSAESRDRQVLQVYQQDRPDRTQLLTHHPDIQLLQFLTGLPLSDPGD